MTASASDYVTEALRLRTAAIEAIHAFTSSLAQPPRPTTKVDVDALIRLRSIARLPAWSQPDDRFGSAAHTMTESLTSALASATAAVVDALRAIEQHLERAARSKEPLGVVAPGDLPSTGTLKRSDGTRAAAISVNRLPPDSPLRDILEPTDLDLPLGPARKVMASDLVVRFLPQNWVALQVIQDELAKQRAERRQREADEQALREHQEFLAKRDRAAQMSEAQHLAQKLAAAEQELASLRGTASVK